MVFFELIFFFFFTTTHRKMRKLSSHMFFQRKQIENWICILHKNWDLDEIFQDMFRAFVVGDSLIVIAYSGNFESKR